MINQLKEIVSNEIHLKKCKLHKSTIPKIFINKIWKLFDSEKMANKIIKDIIKLIELRAFIPCCHTTGMHDPNHFEERKYICESQKGKAFERLCKDLKINPITRSRCECGWCRDYPENRKGEGLKLFKKEKKSNG